VDAEPPEPLHCASVTEKAATANRL
jgi:hypothetical protein